MRDLLFHRTMTSPRKEKRMSRSRSEVGSSNARRQRISQRRRSSRSMISSTLRLRANRKHRRESARGAERSTCTMMLFYMLDVYQRRRCEAKSTTTSGGMNISAFSGLFTQTHTISVPTHKSAIVRYRLPPAHDHPPRLRTQKILLQTASAHNAPRTKLDPKPPSPNSQGPTCSEHWSGRTANAATKTPGPYGLTLAQLPNIIHSQIAEVRILQFLRTKPHSINIRCSGKPGSERSLQTYREVYSVFEFGSASCE